MPPLIGMLHKAGLLHHGPEHLAPPMPGRGPQSFLPIRLQAGLLQVVIRLRDGTDGIDRRAHIQQVKAGAILWVIRDMRWVRQGFLPDGQGEIHCSSRAVGGWGCGIRIGWSPEATDLSLNLLASNAVYTGIDTPFPTD